jgi:flavin-dependent dehydrogenase
MPTDYDVLIVGGGPAGSTAALRLARAGFTSCLVEKETFPRETVCGEFLSHEVIEQLERLGLMDEFLALAPSSVGTFRLCRKLEEGIVVNLPFRAFGMSRGVFDAFLLGAAERAGATILQPAEVEGIVREGQHFSVHLRQERSRRSITAGKVIGAYGRRSLLDKGRPFTSRRSSLNGFKCHLPLQAVPSLEKGVIALLTIDGLYCGMNSVERGMVNVCWLERKPREGSRPRDRLRQLLDLPMGGEGKRFLDLRAIRLQGTGNIYFGRKELIVNGVFMVGDAAGVVAPLAGDGIGMALEGARMLAEVLERQRREGLDDRRCEVLYRRRFHRTFDRRTNVARVLQSVLLHGLTRRVGYEIVGKFPPLLQTLIRATRGGRPDEPRISAQTVSW